MSNEKCPVSGESSLEEWFNFITHGVGFIASIVGLIFLTLWGLWQPNVSMLLASIVYGVSLVLLYGASTWYHGCRCAVRKRTLQSVDHACIYLLIAGSYTPFTLGPLWGPWGWSLLGIVWTIALAGASLSLLGYKFSDRAKSCIYLSMSWLVVVAAGPLMKALSFEGLLWIAAGGLAYTVGVIFYLWERLPFSHAIWHVFVLAGSICHFCCISIYVIPN